MDGVNHLDKIDVLNTALLSDYEFVFDKVIKNIYFVKNKSYKFNGNEQFLYVKNLFGLNFS